MNPTYDDEREGAVILMRVSSSYDTSGISHDTRLRNAKFSASRERRKDGVVTLTHGTDPWSSFTGMS
jgi:hypothetical protein